jgi:sodium transport system permease protein
MRPAQVLTIVRKELVETLRDRRTLLMMIGLPVLVYPLLMMGLSRVQESQQAATEARRSMVAVWGAAPAALVSALQAEAARLDTVAWRGVPTEVRQALEAGSVRPAEAIAAGGDEGSGRRRDGPVRERDNPVLAAARGLLTSREADAVVVAWPGFEPSVSGEGLATATVYFDSVREDSRLARNRVEDVLAQYRESVLAGRAQARQLPAGFSEAVSVLPRDVAPAARRAGYLLGALLPFILVSLSLFGGFYAAIDLTAGEKERGTMQTLMVAPLRSSEIVMGKFLAVWAVGLAAAAANVVSLSLTLTRILPGGEFSIPASAFALAALLLVPITMTTSALFLAVAAFAKDFKDGQNFLTPVYMMIALPAGVTMLPAVELDAWTAFVPVVNIALLVKAVFSGEVRADLLFLVVLSSALYAVLAIALAARVFAREQIMLGGKESPRSVLGLERRRGGVPSPAVALTTFATAMVIAFYASLLVERRGLLTALLVVQYGFFLVPALAVVFGLGYSARETLRLRISPVSHALAALVIGASAWIAIAGLAMRIAPPPESLVKGLEQLLTLGDPGLPLWLVLLVVAVTPAVCEELFFRGVVLSGLRRLGVWPALVVSALLFGFAHASIYRLLPTFALGLMLAWLAWRSGSIVPPMIVHAMNNGLIVWLARHPSAGAWIGLSEATTLPPPGVTLAAAAVCAGGMAVVWWTPGHRVGGGAA